MAYPLEAWPSHPTVGGKVRRLARLPQEGTGLGQRGQKCCNPIEPLTEQVRPVCEIAESVECYRFCHASVGDWARRASRRHALQSLSPALEDINHLLESAEISVEHVAELEQDWFAFDCCRLAIAVTAGNSTV